MGLEAFWLQIEYGLYTLIWNCILFMEETFFFTLIHSLRSAIWSEIWYDFSEFWVRSQMGYSLSTLVWNLESIFYCIIFIS